MVVLKIDDTFQHLLRSDSEIDTLYNPRTIEVSALISQCQYTSLSYQNCCSKYCVVEINADRYPSALIFLKNFMQAPGALASSRNCWNKCREQQDTRFMLATRLYLQKWSIQHNCMSML